jgi:hypothetical protein
MLCGGSPDYGDICGGSLSGSRGFIQTHMKKANNRIDGLFWKPVFV